MTSPDQLAYLRREVDRGGAHTVRVCFADHYGVLRGRRIAADVFLDDPRSRQGFCDGALVWDIRCAIFEGADYSNYSTGYPDLYVAPEAGTLNRCGWVDGEWSVLGDCSDEDGHGIDVDPRGILRSIAQRAGSPPVATALELHLAGADAAIESRFLSGLRAAAEGIGIALTGIERDPDAEVVAIDLAVLAPLVAADALVILRTAARELALDLSLEMTAMSQLRPEGTATRLIVAVLDDGGESRRSTGAVEDLALLIRPLPSGAHGIEPAGEEFVEGASDANPYTVIATAIAATAERAAPSGAMLVGDPYRDSIDRLAACSWASSWFPDRFLHDALALARREADISEAGNGPWDPVRYRECG